MWLTKRRVLLSLLKHVEIAYIRGEQGRVIWQVWGATTLCPSVHACHEIFVLHVSSQVLSLNAYAQYTWAEMSSINAQRNYIISQMCFDNKKHDLAVFTFCWPAKPKWFEPMRMSLKLQLPKMHHFIQLHDTRINSPMTWKWTFKKVNVCLLKNTKAKRKKKITSATPVND